jgi:hypothetical protein
VTLDIAANAVTNAKMADNAIGNAEMLDNAIGNAEMADNAVNTNELVNDAVTTVKILNANVTASKLTAGAGAAGRVGVSDAAGVVTYGSVPAGSITGNNLTSTDLTVTGGTGATLTAVTLDIAANTVTNAKMADNAIGNAEMLDNAIGNAEMADNAVNTNELVNDAVTTVKILNSNVTTTKIADANVTAAKLSAGVGAAGRVGVADAAGAVTYGSVPAGSITGNNLTSTDLTVTGGTGATLTAVTLDIAANAVTNAKMSDNAIGNAEMADNAVNTNELVNDAVTTVKILNANVTASKLTAGAGAAGRVGVADAAGVVTYGSVPAGSITGNNLTSTDLTVTGGTGATLTAVTLDIANNAVTNAKMADNAIGNAEMLDNAITTTEISNGTILNADIDAAAGIAYSKLANLPSANILVGSAGNVATATAVTGDVTISNTGVTTIGALKVTNGMLAGSIASSNLVGTDIATVGTITSGTWNGGVIAGQYGGTGVNNSGKTITLGGNLTTAGAFATTLTSTAATNVTLPVSGTLSTLSGNEVLTNKTINGLTPTAQANGFTISGGTVSATLTVPSNATVSGTNTGDQTLAGLGGVPTTRTINGKSLAADITLGLASADFAGQGTTTTVLHGNAGGAPSFSAISLTADVTGTLPVANGGTGSATQNFVDLTTAQTVGGVKTFSSLPVLSSLTPGSIPFADAGGAITQDNANLFWDNTNKRQGIGTNQPQQLLSIAKTSGKVGLTFGHSATGVVGEIYIPNAGVDHIFTLGTVPANDLAFKTTDITRMTILSGGNVGIGTATPANKLTIGGAAGGYEAISRDITDGALGIWGGTSEATGAYFKITGSTYNASPGNGSAEFVIRDFTGANASRFALWSYDGSTWTAIFRTDGNSGHTWLAPNKGRVGIGITEGTAPTALLQLDAGTAAASGAPLKFTTGTNLTAAEAGAVEYDGTNFYATNSTTTRFTLAKTLTNTGTLDFLSTAANASRDMTITVTGAASGDAVVLGIPSTSNNANSNYSAWVSAANTVTVRFNNYSAAAIDPASGTYRVSVLKY